MLNIESLYQSVFRTDFTEPGYALISLGSSLQSQSFRQQMIELAGELARLDQEITGKVWQIRSLARFNQQVTTKFHLDGSPEAAILILGYEPTHVRSRLQFADYSRAAWENQMTPQQWLEQYNPMYATNEAKLTGFITPVEEFDPQQFQIILVNNSCQSFNPERGNLQGILHQATIDQPLPDQARIINSLIISPVDASATSQPTPAEIDRFVQTMDCPGVMLSTETSEYA
jgi:hypothetical protein